MTHPDDRADLDRARDLLSAANRVLVLTGAGISAESGVPTFRGEGGLWKRHRAEELATAAAFERDPHLVWEWYAMRREVVGQCQPNAAHLALADWMARDEAVTIATQNVDGLHRRALDHVQRLEAAESADGARADARLLEVHGTLFRTRCHDCGAHQPSTEPNEEAAPSALPTCAGCGGLLRPDVVWFGEALDPHVLETMFRWAEQADVCLVVGTSAVVQPAASLATITRETGGAIVEVNPESTPLTDLATTSIRGRAAEVVPAIAPRL